MSIWDDPRACDINQTECQVGSGTCEEYAADRCEDCGKPVCEGCADADAKGYLRCFDCDPEEQKQERKAA